MLDPFNSNILIRLEAIFRKVILSGIHCWDLVAGALLVKEAGGTLLDPRTGADFDYMSRGVLACSSPELAQAVLNVDLKYHKAPRDHVKSGGIWWIGNVKLELIIFE